MRRYYTIYSFRRIAFVTNLMFFANQSHIMLFNFLLIQYAYMTYLGIKMPHDSRWHSKQEMFNELMITLVAYTMLCHIKDQPMYNSILTDNGQYVSGYLTLGFMLTTFFLSMVVLLHETYRNVRKRLLRTKNRRKQQKRLRSLNKVHPESSAGWTQEDH